MILHGHFSVELGERLTAPSWWSWLKRDAKLLEDGVQRRFTKRLKPPIDINYEESAQLLNFDSFSCRMKTGDMVLIYNILHCFLEGLQWNNFFLIYAILRLSGSPYS